MQFEDENFFEWKPVLPNSLFGEFQREKELKTIVRSHIDLTKAGCRRQLAEQSLKFKTLRKKLVLRF